MKKLSSVILAALLLTSSAAFAQDAKEVSDARVAAERWLKLMDSEEYSAAYNSSSAGVKDMSKMAWTMLATATHAPLGEFKSRKLKSSAVKKTKADTEAISFEYESRYEKSPQVKEVVTSTHEKDGVWRVSGYSVSNSEK